MVKPRRSSVDAGNHVEPVRCRGAHGRNAPTDPPGAVVQAAIDAEEAINDRCGRVFAVAGSASAHVRARVGPFVADQIDDCTTVTLVTNNGTTVGASAYQLRAGQRSRLCRRDGPVFAYPPARFLLGAPMKVRRPSP